MYDLRQFLPLRLRGWTNARVPCDEMHMELQNMAEHPSSDDDYHQLVPPY